jgi:hypothetical protein
MNRRQKFTLQDFCCEQCADPDAALITDLSWMQDALCKNRDKQLTFIDRVMVRYIYKFRLYDYIQ